MSERLANIALDIEKLTSLSFEEFRTKYDFEPSMFSGELRALLYEYNDCTSTIRTINRLQLKRYKRKNRNRIVTEGDRVESGAVMTDDVNPIVHVENVQDSEGAMHKLAPSDSSTFSGYAPLTDKNISQYFSRPVQIDSFSLTASAKPAIQLDVWDLYTSEPSVRAKLKNFAFMRGDLHVKFVISGSPFHYAKILVSYQPYPLRNGALQALLGTVAAQPGALPLLENYLSQSKGAATMDIKENEPLEVVCPFISTKPMNRLYNSSAAVLSDVTSYADFENMGTIFFYGLNTVEATTATPSEVTVFVYAWMDPIQISGLTGTQIDITTEGSRVDENETGPVQYYSSKMVSLSKSLSYIPMIKPYAEASKMMFSGLNKIASLFGWSRPMVVSSPSFVKNNWYQNGANIIAHDTVNKLTLEPGQELSVDTSFATSGEDEMVITYISSRTTFWRSVTWDPDDTPMVDTIGYIPVFPYITTTFTHLTNTYVQPTAMCYAATPFRYWRGTIEITFQIVASQYHRGKIGFYYEPNGWQNVLIDAVVEPNKQFFRIIDLQDVQELTIPIEWNSHRAWLANPGYANYVYPYVSLASLAEFANGYVGIVPITSIQSPDNSAVQINIFVSCPDLQVNGLERTNLPLQRAILTEGTLVKDVSRVPLNESSADATRICEHHFGERPLSFRSVLKRYNTYATIYSDANAAARGATTLIEPIIPYILPIYGGSAVTYTTVFSYLRYAYLGLRGSIRKRYRDLYAAANYQDHVVISLRDPTNVLTLSSFSFNTLTSTNANTYIGLWPNGSTVFGVANNGGVEVDYPMYTSNLFLFSCASDLVGTNNTDEMNTRWFRDAQISFCSFTSTSSLSLISCDISTGEDFTMFRFLGAPFYSQVSA